MKLARGKVVMPVDVVSLCAERRRCVPSGFCGLQNEDFEKMTHLTISHHRVFKPRECQNAAGSACFQKFWPIVEQIPLKTTS